MKEIITLFSKHNVLADKLCNILCDQVLTTLRDKGTELEKNDEFITLSGRLAANFQTNKIDPISNVVFVISDRTVFDFHQLNSKKISPTISGVANFKNRTFLYFEQLYIEVWFSETPIETIYYQGELPLQLLSQIPHETL